MSKLGVAKNLIWGKKKCKWNFQCKENSLNYFLECKMHQLFWKQFLKKKNKKKTFLCIGNIFIEQNDYQSFWTEKSWKHNKKLTLKKEGLLLFNLVQNLQKPKLFSRSFGKELDISSLDPNILIKDNISI